jgi:hypothetical protein
VTDAGRVEFPRGNGFRRAADDKHNLGHETRSDLASGIAPGLRPCGNA